MLKYHNIGLVEELLTERHDSKDHYKGGPMGI